MYSSIISIIKDALKLKEKDFQLITNKLFLAFLIKKIHGACAARMDLAVVNKTIDYLVHDK